MLLNETVGEAEPDGAHLPLDRRAFMIGAATLGTLFAGPTLAPFNAVKPSPIRYIVADSRIKESGQFALPFIHHGSERLEVTGGLTALWRDRLLPHWQDGFGAVVGLTSRFVWDGLSQQALGQFRKPYILGTHLLDGDAGSILHKVQLSTLQMDEVHKARFAGRHWATHLADILRNCTPAQSSNTSCVFGDPRAATSAKTQLVSWMIV